MIDDGKDLVPVADDRRRFRLWLRGSPKVVMAMAGFLAAGAALVGGVGMWSIVWSPAPEGNGEDAEVLSPSPPAPMHQADGTSGSSGSPSAEQHQAALPSPSPPRLLPGLLASTSERAIEQQLRWLDNFLPRLTAELEEPDLTVERRKRLEAQWAHLVTRRQQLQKALSNGSKPPDAASRETRV